MVTASTILLTTLLLWTPSSLTPTGVPSVNSLIFFTISFRLLAIGLELRIASSSKSFFSSSVTFIFSDGNSLPAFFAVNKFVTVLAPVPNTPPKAPPIAVAKATSPPLIFSFLPPATSTVCLDTFSKAEKVAVSVANITPVPTEDLSAFLIVCFIAFCATNLAPASL